MHVTQPLPDLLGWDILQAAMEERGVPEELIMHQLGFLEDIDDDGADGMGQRKEQRLAAVMKDVNGDPLITYVPSSSSSEASAAASSSQPPTAPAAAANTSLLPSAAAAAPPTAAGFSMADLLPLPLQQGLWQLSPRGRGAEPLKGVPWHNLGKVVLQVSNPLLPPSAVAQHGTRRKGAANRPRKAAAAAAALQGAGDAGGLSSSRSSSAAGLEGLTAATAGLTFTSSSSSSSSPLGLETDYYCFHLARFASISKQLAAELRLPVLSRVMVLSGEAYGEHKDPLDNPAVGEGGMEQPLVLARFSLGGRHWLSVCSVLADSSKPTGDCFSLPNFLGMPDLEMLLDAQWLAPPDDPTYRGESLDLASYFGPHRLTGLDHDFCLKRPLDLYAIRSMLSKEDESALRRQIVKDLQPFGDRLARAVGMETQRVRLDPTWSGPSLCSREFAESTIRSHPGMQLMPVADALNAAAAADGDDDSDAGDGVEGQDAAYRMKWKAAILPFLWQVYINTPARLAECCSRNRRTCAACGAVRGSRKETITITTSKSSSGSTPSGSSNEASSSSSSAGAAADGSVVKLRTCTGCHVLSYCSSSCQKIHWKYHQELCQRIQKAAKKLDRGL
jgi:hypothetical protein